MSRRSTPNTSLITPSSKAATWPSTTAAMLVITGRVWHFLPERCQSCHCHRPATARDALTMTTDIATPQARSPIQPANTSDHHDGGGPRVAAAFFAAKLRHQTDPGDVAAARAAGQQFILIDVRDTTGWDQGHIPDARHLPREEILTRLDELPPADQDPHLVVYCWGPGCNGSTKAALLLTQAGYRNVREMIGGFEYWAREGLSIVTTSGRRRHPIDELAAPLPKQPATD